MSARDVIRDGIVRETGVTLAWTRADAAIAALSAAGYRVLAPGQIDPETRERCAEIAETASITVPLAIGLADGAASARRHLATAIRAMEDTKS